MTNKEQADALKIEKIDDAYEITGHFPVVGPYDFKQDAESDLRGLQHFYRHEADEDAEQALLDDVLL